ncbi:hypothetical protein A2U01_0074201, partial [Trifolium medium]|nr:hypothetical protein [Trifolium medium]
MNNLPNFSCDLTLHPLSQGPGSTTVNRVWFQVSGAGLSNLKPEPM